MLDSVNHSTPYYQTNMPMFGSTSGGKSGVASTPEKEDTAVLKGARSKEDAD